jgi:chromosome segregation ATPase
VQADNEVVGQQSESQRLKCSDLGEQLDEIHAKLAVSEAQLKREQEEKQQLRKDIMDAERELAERMRDLEHYALSQNELQEEVNDLSSELQEAHLAMSMIEKENLKLKSQIECSAEAIHVTSTEKESLAVNLASSQTDLEETKQHLTILRQQLQAKDKEIEQMQITKVAGEKHKDELVKMLDHLKANLELSQRKIDDLQTEEQLVQTNLATKEQELWSAENLVKSLKSEVASLQGELQDTKDRNNRIENEMVASKGTIKLQSDQIEQLKKQEEATVVELEAAHSKLSTETKTVTQLRAECSKQEAQIKSLSQDILKESQRAGQLLSDFKLVQEQLSTEGEKAGSRMKVLEGDKGKLQGEIKVKHVNMKLLLLMVVIWLQALTSSLESLQAECEELKTNLSKEKEERIQERGNAQAEIKELKLQLQNERESKHDMSGQLISKERHIQSLAVEMGNVKDQMLREKQTEQRELRRVLERMQSDSVKQQAKHEEQLMQTKQAMRQAVEREKLLQDELQTSETQKTTLQSQIETLRAKNRGDHDNIKALEMQLQQVRNELGQAVNTTTKQKEEFTKLQESHDEEVRQLMERQTQTISELSASREVSQYLTKEKDALQDQVKQLQSQLTDKEQHVDNVKETYREDVRNVTEKMERLTHCLSEAQRDNRQVQQSYEKKLLDSEAKVTSLEAALGQQALEKRMVESEKVSLSSRLERSSQDLDTALKAQSNYEKTIQLEKENWRKEHVTMRDELQRQKEKMVTLMAQLTEANSNIQALEEDNEVFHTNLKREQQAVADAQLQQNQLLHENEVTRRQVQLLSEEKASISSELVQCKEIIQEERAQSAALRQHLQESITQVQERHEVSLQAQSKFNSVLGSLQAEFERDRLSLEKERDDLRKKLLSEKTITESLKKQVRQTESQLARSNDELAHSARKATDTTQLLDNEISLRTDFQQQAETLNSQLTKSKLEMDLLSETVSKTEAANNELQLKLDHAEWQCHSLTDQLNEEKVAATSAQTSIREQHQQLTTRLERELAEVSCQLTQANAQLNLAKEELVSTCQARQDLSNAVDELNEMVEQLREDLRNEMNQRKLAQQQSDHFEKALNEKKSEKVSSDLLDITGTKDRVALAYIG